MRSYFQFFPAATYNFDSSSHGFDIVTNIFSRVKFLDNIVSNINSYYTYTVQDSDNPEIIAHKYYQDANRYWLVLLFNRYLDPYFSFPMNTDNLEASLANQYGSIEIAQNTLKQIEKQTVINTYINGRLTNQSSNTYVISGNTSVTYDFPHSANTESYQGSLVSSNYPALNYPPIVENLGPFVNQEPNGLQSITIKNTYYAISVYDYEVRSNDQRRVIQLVDSKYVGEIELEFQKLLKGG
jgi:hypothetical protein